MIVNYPFRGHSLLAAQPQMNKDKRKFRRAETTPRGDLRWRWRLARQRHNQTLLDILMAEVDLPKETLIALVESGAVRVRGRRVYERDWRVTGDSEIVVAHNPHIDRNDYPLDIVFEDDSIVVVNKPAGQLTHGTELGDFGSLSRKLKQTYGLAIELVHRLDKETSGLLVAAKNADAFTQLTAQFQTAKIEKHYIAIIEEPIFVEHIQKPILKDGLLYRAALPTEKAKPAHTQITSQTALANGQQLVSIRLHTGRTHQIRVHLQYLTLPIVGDSLYGGISAERLMLHAQRLSLSHPVSGESQTFQAPQPFG